ncbi:hypothetical protein K431DRAFT_297570 [Polychaeton citri CBS 116435]|uniref:Ig-like domain-containing protein n=1 Tax=Polychaeton citri CBS 116435 TaxID=1314669 RepID=A0A9P4Q0X1_9PEZI|nr:hypothetical protein K431DRAFT_297570 [Polychaeton citri CBS 116435]
MPSIFRWLSGFALLASLASAMPAPQPGITPAPLPKRRGALAGRQFNNITTVGEPTTTAAPITSCALTSEDAFTLDGQAFPATIACACNDGWTAGINTVVGDDGNTSYECAVGTTTTMVVSVETPAPTPTWHIRVNAGSSDFLVGDVDQSTLKDVFSAACGSDGCDGGSPQEFEFKTENSAGHTTMSTGEFTMDGFTDGNQAMMDAMIESINAALLQTSTCSTESVTQCMNDAKRSMRLAGRNPETPAIALDCGKIDLTQCRLANYMQATTYDPDGKVMGQVKLSAKSEEPGPFSCSDFLDPISTLLGGFELPPLAEGALTVAEFACGLIDDATGASDDGKSR